MCGTQACALAGSSKKQRGLHHAALSPSAPRAGSVRNARAGRSAGAPRGARSAAQRHPLPLWRATALGQLPRLQSTRSVAPHHGRLVTLPRCARVSYASQRGDAVDRTWIKQQKAEARLIDGWQRPKRMRQTTWKRLMGIILDCEQQRDEAIERMLAQYGETL